MSTDLVPDDSQSWRQISRDLERPSPVGRQTSAVHRQMGAFQPRGDGGKKVQLVHVAGKHILQSRRREIKCSLSVFFACGHWPAAGLVVASEIWRKCHGSKFKKFKNLGNLTNNLKMWYNTKVFGHIILIFWHSLFLPLRLFGGCRNANIFAILAVV